MPISKRTIPVLFVIILITVAVFIGAVGCSRKEEPKRVERVTVAISPWPASTPLYIAQDQGYFREEGIEPVFNNYESGHLALNAALAGKADLATASDTPIVRAVVSGKPLSIIATISEIDRSILIIARKDRGIMTPGDLKGKKIGLAEGSSAEYFLHVYLAASYINPKDVRIVDLAPDKVVDSLLKGAVDAVSTWSPHTIILRDKLADKALILHDPRIYRMTWNIVGAKDYIGKNPQRIEKFLRALLKAATYIKQHPNESRAVSSKYIGVNSLLYNQEWENYHFTLMLDQSLILNLEDQARWMIIREDGSARKMPDFFDVIFADGLKSVQPGAVRIAGK